MKLDYYKSGKSSGKRSAELDYAGLLKVLEEPRLRTICDAFRGGDAEAKKNLPCIAYMGRSKTGQRKADLMEPTGLVMLDIDHCEKPRECFEHVKEHLGDLQLLAAHITPSGKGLRLVLRNLSDLETITDNIVAMAKQIEVGDFGEVDTCCKDLSRISFLVPKDEWLLLSEELFADAEVFVKEAGNSIPTEEQEGVQETEPMPIEDCHDYDGYRYNGHLVKDIIAAYCQKYWPKTGQPEVGKRHMFYNQMVVDFRNLVDNDPKILHALLPRFGNSAEETWGQCRSICSRNNKTRHSKEFYFFLKDNGYYQSPTIGEEEYDDIDDDPYAEAKELVKRMPKLPPVFREYVNAAPADFKIPTVFALLPVMGTLTSYLSAYYMDGELNTTSFISIIYAPPSSGKSFVKRIVDKLLADIKARDMVSAAREMIYMNVVNRKGSNEKSPEDPKVTMRIMPPINSLPELLIKMRNNQGYHMFTYCEEMDTWTKGSKAQGGDKNDMFRIAWDNGSYGQAYKSTGTFKGEVDLYWNVLITGTINQVHRYFKDVENGLITRCSFSDLGDQRFADMPIFKRLTERDMQIIDRFLKRCDENTYMAPLDFDTNRLYDIKDSDFDQEVPWKYEYKQRQVFDLSWIFPALNKWLANQQSGARDGMDDAMDRFRRRCAVRGFRLALLCYALYPRVGVREQALIQDFVLWFMDCDLHGIMSLWGIKYNQMMSESSTPKVSKYHNNLFVELPDEFTMQDLNVVIMKYGNTTNAVEAIHLWKKTGLIEKIGKGRYRKIRKKQSVG
jgi:hypothetical protein